MRLLYYLKWPLIIFTSGFLIRVVGSLLKIMHWPLADELLILSAAIMAAGVIAVIIKLILLKKEDK